MQGPSSLAAVGAVVALVMFAIALTVFASAFLAVPLFLVGFGAFLMWRGKQRAAPAPGERNGTRVPTTEEAAADPAGDSGVRDAARSSSSHAS